MLSDMLAQKTSHFPFFSPMLFLPENLISFPGHDDIQLRIKGQISPPIISGITVNKVFVNYD